MQRFWSKVDKTDECWVWEACKNRAGYGWFRYGGRPQLAHRVAWALTHGSLPGSLDHDCHTRAVQAGLCQGGDGCPHRSCVRPDHLREVTAAQNAAASPLVLTTINSAKTRCVQGHPLTGDNVAVREGGRRRRCLTCARASKNKSMARLRAGERA